ncbi:hypothetical protein Lqui_2437 [Legionella quinlivanii]|uniref:Plasmid maintenance system killer protein n=1 Tax=Legionella quinlivanii TaxID=45073 RepID=A0A0W0XRX1_9GAMM|nr:type II toxin-antitoxin system mRNA interferase toxin, RelE/StbE family [Legionella quinlivanii]KTD47511.1 hypothetical protein Lqui_2437 [Legionella quinlivanii]SEG50222.1 proteic killer suppression protein [Legionella quinlivanii DSM 21216]STY49801.1 Plasmid maintenance system killer protein [Legionella quinlivanii]
MNIYTVVLTKNAKRDLQKVPPYIAVKLAGWIESVAHDGLLEVRKVPGFHDEPLKGNRVGQRSIRLSKSYRAIYKIGKNGEMEIVEVLEVNKHDY